MSERAKPQGESALCFQSCFLSDSVAFRLNFSFVWKNRGWREGGSTILGFRVSLIIKISCKYAR